jgi:signal transduction histidine kinase
VLAGNDASLDIALRQLSLTEEQIKGMLALGARRPQELRGGDLRQIAANIATLVEPMCQHVQVSLKSEVTLGDAAAHVHDADSIRAAILNLVTNAIEAAGPHGEVTISVSESDGDTVVAVADTGPGPPPATEGALFEPFITSKQEGVGLGLTLAQHTARHYDGTLTWRRSSDRTVFEMRWPQQSVNRSVAEGISRTEAVMAAIEGKEARGR